MMLLENAKAQKKKKENAKVQASPHTMDFLTPNSP